MGIKRRAADLIETVAGFALMAVAFGPRATAMIAFEAYRPRRWGGDAMTRGGRGGVLGALHRASL